VIYNISFLIKVAHKYIFTNNDEISTVYFKARNFALVEVAFANSGRDTFGNWD
jgi:hypothetical protein